MPKFVSIDYSEVSFKEIPSFEEQTKYYQSQFLNKAIQAQHENRRRKQEDIAKELGCSSSFITKLKKEMGYVSTRKITKKTPEEQNKIIAKIKMTKHKNKVIKDKMHELDTRSKDMTPEQYDQEMNTIMGVNPSINVQLGNQVPKSKGKTKKDVIELKAGSILTAEQNAEATRIANETLEQLGIPHD